MRRLRPRSVTVLAALAAGGFTDIVMTVPSPASRMSLTPVIDPIAAPLLGEHTKDVLSKTLGYDDERLARLTEAGAFGKLRTADNAIP